MNTPSKKSENSSMTHEEEEKMQHDISNLRDQVQQISLSQKVTKNELEAMMNVKIYGIKRDMGFKVDGIKRDMGVFNDGLKADVEVMMNFKIEGLKEGLEKLLEERLPNGDKVIHENHDEDKRNMNYDSRVSNVGFKNHHIPNIDMRKFDGKDPVTWILQMEQYFYLHDVKPSQKVHIASLYLQPN